MNLGSCKSHLLGTFRISPGGAIRHQSAPSSARAFLNMDNLSHPDDALCGSTRLPVRISRPELRALSDHRPHGTAHGDPSRFGASSNKRSANRHELLKATID
jgi:hypothetical protein